jgi:hypothetical protein
MIAMVNVWSGSLPFSLRDPVSKQAVEIGRKYVDPHTQERTKVGRAKRSLAPRLAVYLERGYNHSKIPNGTLSPRVVIYGNGRAMPSEPDIQRVPRGNADRLYCECADGVTRPVSRENYFGTEVVRPLTDFARQTERAGTP